MILLAIFVTLLLIVGIILYLWNRHRLKKNAEQGIVESPAPEIPQECCGQHEVCERDSLLAAVSREIVYYDDEELDAWRGTPADAYDEHQINTFGEILYTMRNDEVAGWVRSLQLRGIELPNEIKDEVFLIIGERRNHPQTNN